MFFLMFLLNLKTTFALIQYQYFNECESNLQNTNLTILKTLNGNIQGQCLVVPVSYSNGSTISNKVFRWLSVPYAQAPINENRFKNPIPISSWNLTLDGTKWPNRCIQNDDSGPIALPMSEDCLYLNIFVRSDSYLNQKSPILVWIHGGGFTSDSSTNDLYEASTLASMTGIIIVTINYRLNVFGFMRMDDTDVMGNQGLLDQNLALNWIYDNAFSFNGDNSRITIAGESAGARSVGFHLFFPKSWPYFRNAILQSGGATARYMPLISPLESTNRARELLIHLNCSSNNTNVDMVKCGQKLSANLLVKAIDNYLKPKIYTNSIYSRNSITIFPPVLDGVVFTEPIDVLLRKKKFKKCKVISGFNTNEMAFFITVYGMLGSNPLGWEANAKSMNRSRFIQLINETFYYYPFYPVKNFTKTFLDQLLTKYLPLNSSASYFKSFESMWTDFMYACQSFQLAKAYSQINLEAYFYQFNFRISTSFLPYWFGVGHIDDDAIVFAEPLANKLLPILPTDNWYTSTKNNYSIEEKKFTENFLSYWTSFIKHNDPNYLRIQNETEMWLSFSDDAKILEKANASVQLTSARYLVFNQNKYIMSNDFSSHHCDLWGYTSGITASFKQTIFSKLSRIFLSLILYGFLKQILFLF